MKKTRWCFPTAAFGVLWLLSTAAAAAAEPPDVKALLAEVISIARGADREAWGRHAFHRQVTRQQIDEDGDVEFKQVMLFQVTPEGDGFDELLLEIDGRQPTPKEVAKHRKSGRFEKHYKQTKDVLLENPFGSDLPLLPLVFEQEHRYVGEDQVDGIPCHRVRFEPRPEPTGATINDKLRHAMRGSLCLSIEGSRSMEIELESTREVGSGAIKIYSMGIRFQARPQGDAWLPTRFELRSDVKILGTKLRRHNIYRYSDYRLP